MSQLKKGRGYVTKAPDELTRVGIELLGQLKNNNKTTTIKHQQ